MALRLALFVLMALGLAGFGAVLWIGAHPPAPRAVAVPPEKILVAARPLRGGSLLKPEDVTTADVAPGAAPEGASRDTPAARTSLYGAMVRRSLAIGEAILPAEIMRPGDHGFLAAVLGPDMRAVTVAVDIVTGSAGLIWPGDRVDLILTQTLDPQSAPPSRRVAAETVLANVRVIAIDQQLVQGASPDAPDQKAARTVTLEVSPQGAEEVTVAAKLGHLSLVVRAADPGTAPTPTAARPSITWAGKVSPALVEGDAPHGASKTMRVYQGGADGKEFHF
ncbi:MAG: Flp pilus assembly protein CpaB [Acidibrevibacterium sp.]|uniref:Flp pilus assembly protein CpaB n=1 Tax=Acidibrevibacterium TaxID=2603324 RepID=UPI000E0D80F6|nr:Flp pilus assembly protein CpaB [Acidibrevibacterium fodinaquatile]